MSPKQRFISTRNTEPWNNVAASAMFVEACDFALLELVSQGRENNAYSDQARAHQIDGAREVLRLLSTIGLKEEPKEHRHEEPLDYGYGHPQPIPIHKTK